MYLEKNRLKSISTSIDPNPSAATAFIPYDIPLLIENMKTDKDWKAGEITSMVLLKSPAKKVVLALFHEGTEMSSFQINDSATFKVIEGKLDLKIGKESFILSKGEVLTLTEKTEYLIDSINETALLLILDSEK